MVGCDCQEHIACPTGPCEPAQWLIQCRDHLAVAVCAQVLAVLRGLTANPEQAIDQSGDTDEEKAEAVEKARTPKAPEKSPEKAPETKAK